MDKATVKVLLIDDDPDDHLIIRDLLFEAGGKRFALDWEETYETGLKAIRRNHHDVCLLDFHLGPRDGVELLREAIQNGCKAPIIMLTGKGDQEVDLEAMEAGAADYMIKGRFDAALLERSIRYAIQRNRTVVALQGLSVVDDLTGLYNRRGFYGHAEQVLELSLRKKRGALLIYVDLDGLKKINDTLGHRKGDWALMETARILKQTCRAPDVAARMGGDEFALLVTEATRSSDDAILARLRENLDSHNAAENSPFKLSLSIGTAFYDANRPRPIEELLAEADEAMYSEKRKKTRQSKDKAPKAGRRT